MTKEVNLYEDALTMLKIRQQQLAVGSWWRHVKTGKVYTIEALALNEADLTSVVVYKEVSFPKSSWVRPVIEFIDRRFVPLPNVR